MATPKHRPAEAAAEDVAAAEEYARAHHGQDAAAHVRLLKERLPSGARVLELGSGPGVDLLLLRRSFDAHGSDPAAGFRQRFARRHPEQGALLNLDASLQDLPEALVPLDAIFSNKVLHLLSRKQHQASVRRQAELLRDGGLVLHTYWNREHWNREHNREHCNREHCEDPENWDGARQRPEHGGRRNDPPPEPASTPRRFTSEELDELWSGGLFTDITVTAYSTLGHQDSLRLVARKHDSQR